MGTFSEYKLLKVHNKMNLKYHFLATLVAVALAQEFQNCDDVAEVDKKGCMDANKLFCKESANKKSDDCKAMKAAMKEKKEKRQQQKKDKQDKKAGEKKELP